MSISPPAPSTNKRLTVNVLPKCYYSMLKHFKIKIMYKSSI